MSGSSSDDSLDEVLDFVSDLTSAAYGYDRMSEAEKREAEKLFAEAHRRVGDDDA